MEAASQADMLLFDSPQPRHWMPVPFSPNRDCPEEVVKLAYRNQNTWEKECFSLPVAGIRGDIHYQVPKLSSNQPVPFLQWLLQQQDSNSTPFLRTIECSNNYKYFFITMFQQRHEATAWVDGLNNTIDKTFTVEQRMAIFGSERASLRRTNRLADEPRRTPVDEVYSAALLDVIGNPQEFPALEADKKAHEMVGPAESAWKRPISILYGEAARELAPAQKQTPSPPAATDCRADISELERLLQDAKNANALKEEKARREDLERLATKVAEENNTASLTCYS